MNKVMQNLRNLSSIYIYIYIGCALSLLSTFFIGNNLVFAEDITTNVNIQPSLTLSLSASSLALNLDPSATTFGYKDLNVSVGTNNPTGYKLIMTTTSGTSDLVNTEDNTKVIETLPTLAGGYTESTFETNKWGYSNNNSNYLPFVPNTLLSSSDTATNDIVSNMKLAAKIDYLQESGTYATELQFTVTANPVCDTTISGVMQTFAPCPDMAIGTSGTLTDARDGKTYTAAKLKDGQIWMTSNLNLAGGTALYSDDSDVDPANTRASGTPYYTLPDGNGYSGKFSSDTTAYVYNTGNETTSQANCTSTQPCNSYYSWLAATAGGKDVSGTAVTGNGYNAAYSICPKGWRLPTATTEGIPRDSGGYTGGDFYKMILAAKDVTSLPNGYYAYPDSTPTFYTTAGPNTLPNFLLAGYYLSSTFYSGGAGGYYWSSSSISSTRVYNSYFGSSNVNSADNNDRRYGFSVRCVLAEV